MPAQVNTQPRARAAAALLGDLQRDPLEAHGVIQGDDALFLVAEDLVEVDATEANERRSGVRRRASELRVEGWQKALPQVAIGGGQRADGGDAQLVHEAILQRAIHALTAPAGLRRV